MRSTSRRCGGLHHDFYRDWLHARADVQKNYRHERNYEILASGGFPLVKSLEADELQYMDNITNYFREDEEIVLFYNRDDLLNKVQYYLDNPDDRDIIAEKGRKVVISNISSPAIVKNTMEFVRNYYDDNKESRWRHMHSPATV